MPSTTYASSYPRALFAGNLQSERITDDASVLAQARDYNIHDVELRAMQQAIGIHVQGTNPTGTVLGRLWGLENGGIGSQVHHINGSYHSGQLDISRLAIDTTTNMGSIIDRWMTKMWGTGDIDADGLMTMQDVMGAHSLNKEYIDDKLQIRYSAPWTAPTGGGNPVPGPAPPPPPPGPLPGPGGWDPTDPLVPVDDIWCGLGPDGAGDYTQFVGMLVNFDTGAQYGIKRYIGAGPTTLLGTNKIGDIVEIETFETPAAGTNYGLMYSSEPWITGAMDENGLITNAAGALVLERKQVQATVDVAAGGLTTLNIGDHVFLCDESPVNGANVSISGWDGVDGVAVGWCRVIDIGVGAGTVPARIVAPDDGVVSIFVVTSSPANNAGAQFWNVQLQHKVGRVTATTVVDTITPNAVLDTPMRSTLASALAVAKDDIINIDFVCTTGGTYGQNLILHAIAVEYDQMGA